VNPRAGAGRAAKVAAEAVAVLRRAGIEPTVHVCANGSEPALVAARSRDEGADVVAAVGGDGLVAGVAEGLLAGAARANGIALAVMATGSANDYARALGVRKLSIPDQVALIADPAARASVDVIGVETGSGPRHILNIGGTGFDALVAERAMRITRLRGAPRYVAAMLAELRRFNGADFTLTLDGEVRHTRAMMIAIANGTTYGGGMRVAPQAHLQNGWLDVCVIGQLTRTAFLRAFPSVFRGAHTSHPAVTMLRAREVSLASDRRFAILGDGELVGELPATFRVLPRALSVVVAPGASLA
jgi:diacylglycerol kinase (ATP)